MIGDDTPELIYTTIVEESGEAAVTVNTTLYYTRKAVIHLVTYDSGAQRVYDVFDLEAIAIDDRGEYTHFGLWTDEYYTVDGYKSFYHYSNINASGTFADVTEYQYDASSGQCIQTYSADYDVYGQGVGYAVPLNEISNPAAKMVAGSRTDPKVRLLFDAYGNSDYDSMTFDEAILYLGGSSQSSARAADYTYQEILSMAQLVMYRYNEMSKHAGCASLALEDASDKVRNMIGQETYKNYRYLPYVSKITDCHSIEQVVDQRKEYFSEEILGTGYGDEYNIRNLTEYEGSVYVTWTAADWNLFYLDTIGIASFDENGVTATCYREEGGEDIPYVLYFTFHNDHLKLMSAKGSY